MAHGVRRHMARGVCDRKMAFTTWSAAYAKLTEVPGAIRVVRGSCCGYFHITSMTEAEFAQAVADAEGCTDAWNRGKMDLSTEEFLKQWEKDHVWEDRQAGAQQGAYAGGPRATSQRGSDEARPAPTPATVARRLQERSDQGR